MNLQNKTDRVVKGAAVFLIVAGIIALLQYFRAFLQPFIVALILWFLITEVRKQLNKINIKGRRLPRPVLSLISTVAVFSIFYVITDLIIMNFQFLAQNANKYADSLVKILEKIEVLFGVDNLGATVSKQQSAIVSSASVAAKALASFIGRFFLVIFYVLFLLLEEVALGNKMKKIYRRGGSQRSVRDAFSRISSLLSDYLGIKILTSFLTGFLSYFVLLLIGIDLPVLWAFLIFVLNFIPSIGSIVATSFPVIFSFLQYSGEWGKALAVLLGVLGVQVFIGNFLEPRILGNRLNLSPLVVILGLTFWGFVWGFVGMLLSVPIMATLMIVFSQFEDTRNMAIMFSKDGDIEYLIHQKDKEET
jgi:AI-2 transport protein TqsA